MIGARIQEARKLRGLNQTELSKASGVAREQISRYESERSKPDFEIVIKIADALNVSIDYLVGRSDVMEISTSKSTSEPATQTVYESAKEENITPPFSADQLDYLEQWKKDVTRDVVDALREDLSSLKEQA